MSENKNVSGSRPMAAGGLLVVGVLFGFGLGAMLRREAPETPAARSAGHAVDPVGPGSSAAYVERGGEIFAEQCAPCHGAGGKGDGSAAYLLYPRPRDFSTGRYRMVSTVNGQPTDADLYRSITDGMPGSAMPPWNHLPEDDRWALVYYVRDLARRAVTAELIAKGIDSSEAGEIAVERLTPADEVAIPDEPPVTADSLARGREIYIESCSSCHDLDGRGRLKTDLVDSSGRAIRARDFTAGVFKGGSDGRAIARRLLAGIPDTPMPSFARDLKGGEDLWALVHYVQSMVAPGAMQRVRQEQRDLVARRVEAIENDPAAAAWSAMNPTYVALMPLWWRNDRVEGVNVRAVHDGKRLALHLSWEDNKVDEFALRPEEFSDSLAVQFTRAEEPPFLAMGAPGEPVLIWQWKASWQRDLIGGFTDVDDAHPDMAVDSYDSLRKPPFGEHSSPTEHGVRDFKKEYVTGWGAGNRVSDPDRETPVDSLVAEGFGTLAARPKTFQNVDGRAVHDKGLWRLVLVRDLAGAGDGDVAFAAGETLSLGFAVWEGAGGDRNGQKSVSIWHRLELED